MLNLSVNGQIRLTMLQLEVPLESAQFNNQRIAIVSYTSTEILKHLTIIPLNTNNYSRKSNNR